MFEDEANNKTTISKICKYCQSTPCRFGLKKDSLMGCVMVLNRSMAVSKGCPLLINDEYWIRDRLFNLDNMELDRQRIAALEGEWNSGNPCEVYYGYGNPVSEAVEYIVDKWRQGKITIIGLIPGQKIGDWENGYWV